MQIFEEGEDEPTPGISLVSKNTEMPEGVEFSDGDGKDSDENNDDPHKALGEINLDDLEFHENNKESHRTLISNDSFLTCLTHIVIDGVDENDRFCDLLLLVLCEAMTRFKALKLVLLSKSENPLAFK